MNKKIPIYRRLVFITFSTELARRIKYLVALPPVAHHFFLSKFPVVDSAEKGMHAREKFLIDVTGI